MAFDKQSYKAEIRRPRQAMRQRSRSSGKRPLARRVLGLADPFQGNRHQRVRHGDPQQLLGVLRDQLVGRDDPGEKRLPRNVSGLRVKCA